MSLTTINLNAVINWTLTTSTPGFSPTVQKDSGLTFTLGGIDLSLYPALRADNYDIGIGATFDFDLWDFVDLNNNSTGFTSHGIIALFIKPVVGNIQMGPSPSDGLQWPFVAGAGQGLTMTAGGVYVFSLPATGPAQPVTALTRNIRITNSDSVAATGYFIAVGG